MARGANRHCRMRPLEHTHAVRAGVVRISRRGQTHHMRLRGHPRHHRKDEVHQVTAQVVHDAALEGGNVGVVVLAAVVVVHVGLDRDDVAEPALLHGLLAEADRRVHAEHVADLDRDATGLAEVHQRLELLEVLSAGLVEMHREPMLRHLPRNRDQVVVRHLHEHALDGLVRPQLLGRHPRHTVEDLEIAVFTRGLRFTVVDDAHEFVVVRQLLHALEFAVGVLMAHPPLHHSDLLRVRERLPRHHGRRARHRIHLLRLRRRAPRCRKRCGQTQKTSPIHLFSYFKPLNFRL